MPSRSHMLVPPGGYAGFAQMTAAAKNQLAKGARGGQRKQSGLRIYKPKSKRKRMKRKSSGLRIYKPKSKRRTGPMRLVKGSAAAKAYMAKIRRKRKR